ncbi:LysR substrate-binding domain-containing protein [Photobacterium sp. TY1-4]|uniref:LysR substrate-binding domain-containing protein n=1 Tax=Photobacterium sp. TY1-4 TaxID=2899122 RepID=UPI0021C10AAA|nr:LysR substrate-binding domain-containing protein [Photobacterium sp. TY1-4]UXI03703.1 LysR substrate-binding domain-containing protein [Photobacterium sp. TY1-4]
MKMPLKSIYYFESVARLGSYSAAAKEMFVTHAAVIGQVKTLEQWMGKKLVYRQQNRVMLTEAGAAFAAQLTEPFAQLRDAVQTHRKEGHNKLVIGCLPSLATCFLLPHIHDFKTRYPDIELTLQYQLAAAENTADFVLGFTDEPLTETMQELFNGATVPVCGREYAAKIEEFSANHLNQYDLLHDEDRRAWQRWYERYADAQTPEISHPPVSRGTVFSDFNMMRIAAINNNGIALCPKALIATELGSGELVQLSPLAGNRNRRYYLRANGVSGDSQRAFSDWVMALAQSKIA